MNTQQTAPALPHPSLDVPHLLRRMACWLYEGKLLFGVVFISA